MHNHRSVSSPPPFLEAVSRIRRGVHRVLGVHLPNKARWCSMADGNRVKARRRYERTLTS